MKNFITPFLNINLKKNKEKILKEKSFDNKSKLVHYRRDLDSIG